MTRRYRVVPASILLSIVLVAIAVLNTLTTTLPACAIEAQPLRESHREGSLIGAPCPLVSSTDGTGANLRWYNICSGYVWLFSGWAPGDAVGVRFGGPEQPAVNDGNTVKRAITYYRNVVVGYAQTVDVFVDIDSDGDGCPDAPYVSDLNLDPALRWNCSEFDTPIPTGVTSLIVRTRLDGSLAPRLATDGPFSENCDPIGVQRSYYYPANSSECVPWGGQAGRNDNFLYWLIVDSGTGDPVPVACCLPDGACQVILPTDCIAAGGVPRYDELECVDGVCDEERACCFPDGTCQLQVPPDCEAAGGRPQAAGSNCASVECPPDLFACCFSTGECYDLSLADCNQAGGIPQGDGSECATASCPSPEACCFPNGFCSELLAPACTDSGGVPQGEGTRCETTQCPEIQPAACCFFDGSCVLAFYDDCLAQGGFPGDPGTVCEDDGCTGACCFADFSCQQMTGSACAEAGGYWVGAGTSCTSCSAPQPTGACCFMDSSCQVMTASECAAEDGDYQGDGTSCVSCAPNAVEPTSWGHIKGLYR
jgi:hypothetical protein